jgi:hypothetical protein
MGQSLTREQAQRQAARLDASPTIAPRTEEGLTELVDCLLRCCQNEEHARTVITQLLDGVPRLQSLTAEIVAIAAATRKRAALPPGCEICQGAPWLMGGQNGAVRCSCARGEALRKGIA